MSPTRLAEELAKDAAVREADTLLLTVPNQLGVEYNAHLLETIVRHVAPAIGWVHPQRTAGASLPPRHEVSGRPRRLDGARTPRTS